LAIFVLWTVLAHLRRRLVLRRISTWGPSEFAALPATLALVPLFDVAALRRASVAFRRAIPEQSSELDVVATVETTARGGGLGPLRYAQRRSTPEYLALVERESPQDHQARLADEKLNLLRGHGVNLDRYFYARDPRTVYEDGPATGRRAIHDVLGRHHRATTLLFVDAERLFSPVTGRPEVWTTRFPTAVPSAVVTPVPPSLWTRQEWELTEAGFAVVPDREESLARYAEDKAGWNIDSLFPASYARPYPGLLTRQPYLAFTRAEPPPETVVKLVRQLKGYLGDRGFAWLAACAVYPEIAWQLTLHLSGPVWATTAGPEREKDLGTRLATLARLPWFRSGYMPDWLRAALLSQLSQAQDATIRRSLHHRLSELIGTTLGQRDRSTNTGLEIHSRISPRDVLKAVEPGTALGDRVFVTYMAGAEVSTSALEAPSSLRRLFRRIRGLPAEVSGLQRASRTFRQRVAARVRGLTLAPPTLTRIAGSVGLTGVALAAVAPLALTAPVLVSGAHPQPNMAFSSSGDRLLTTSEPEGAVLWDARTGRKLYKVSRPGQVVTFAGFSPDSSLLVTASSDGSVSTWATSNNSMAGRFQCSAPVTSAAFSPDGAQLVTVTAKAEAQLWDARTGSPLSAPVRQEVPINGMTFSPDGARVALLGTDSVLRLWHPVSPKVFRTSYPVEGHVSPRSFSPDGKQLVTATKDKKVTVWDLASGHEDIVMDLPVPQRLAQFTSDGRAIVTVDAEGTVRTWDTMRFAPLGQAVRVARSLPPQDSLMGPRLPDLRLSSDGTLLLVGPELWDLKEGLLTRFSSPVTAATFSEDSQMLAVLQGTTLSVGTVERPPSPPSLERAPDPVKIAVPTPLKPRQRHISTRTMAQAAPPPPAEVVSPPAASPTPTPGQDAAAADAGPDAEADPTTAQYLRGVAAFDVQDYVTAIAHLRPLLEARPMRLSEAEVALTHRMLGVSYFETKQEDLSRRHFERLLVLRPEYRLDSSTASTPAGRFFSRVVAAIQNTADGTTVSPAKPRALLILAGRDKDQADAKTVADSLCEKTGRGLYRLAPYLQIASFSTAGPNRLRELLLERSLGSAEPCYGSKKLPFSEYEWEVLNIQSQEGNSGGVSYVSLELILFSVDETTAGLSVKRTLRLSVGVEADLKRFAGCLATYFWPGSGESDDICEAWKRTRGAATTN
jgi:hypothetical protein